MFLGAGLVVGGLAVILFALFIFLIRRKNTPPRQQH
jgi:hypothetical protein